MPLESGGSDQRVLLPMGYVRNGIEGKFCKGNAFSTGLERALTS